MHVAGYGPRVLAVAGRVGDGVIIQLADPDIIRWTMETARAAAAEAGDPAALKCIVCAPTHISDDLAAAREQVRWFPAMVSNHVRDLIARYGRRRPGGAARADRLRAGRDALRLRRAPRVGARHGAFVSDEIRTASACWARPSRRPRSCRAGADRRRSVQHLSDDRGPGADLETYGREIIPRFAGVTGGGHEEAHPGRDSRSGHEMVPTS